MASAIARHYAAVSDAFSQAAAVEIPTTPDEAGDSDPRPAGRPSHNADSYKKLRTVTKSWERYVKAEAELSKSMHVLLVRVGQWGADIGDSYARRTMEVRDASRAWEEHAAFLITALGAAGASFNSIEAFEKEIDAKWREVEEVDRAIQKQEKKLAKMDANAAPEDDPARVGTVSLFFVCRVWAWMGGYMHLGEGYGYGYGLCVSETVWESWTVECGHGWVDARILVRVTVTVTVMFVRECDCMGIMDGWVQNRCVVQ